MSDPSLPGQQSAQGSNIAQADHGGIAVVGDGNVIHTGQPYRPPLQRPPRAEHFTDRETELATLLEQLRPGHVCTLCGPGGIGKTALAAEVLWTLAPGEELPAHFPDGVFYHTFYNQPQADLALESLALAFGEEVKPNPQAAARRALAGRAALLLLDGAEDADNLPAVLDVKGQCGVLITSRKHGDAPAAWQDVRPLPPAEAVSLLHKWGGNQSDDYTVCEALCHLMGGLPLAVRLAGRYLAQTGDTTAEYLAWLKSSPLEALDQGNRRRDSVPVLLEKSLRQVSEAACAVLAVAGLLALAPIEREALAAALAVAPDTLRQPLRELLDFGLLQRSGPGYNVSHVLILTYARKLDHPADIPERLADYYSTLFKEQSTQGSVGFARLHPARPHLLTLLNRLAQQQKAQAFTLLNAADDYLRLQGFNLERQLVWQTGLRLAQALKDSRQQANCIQALGEVHLRLAEYEAARDRYEEARPIYAQIGDRLGEANCIDSLGQLAMRQQDWLAAVQFLQAGLQIYQAINSAYDVAWSHYFLGQVSAAQNDPAKARHYYQTAAKLFEAIKLQPQVDMVQQALAQLSSQTES
ncbi:MAG: tetratricopeptide repeat protein [Anaerolineae bacterium]|nr:tetratricopeptide repeat protein [Anaerolineae bacterium]